MHTSRTAAPTLPIQQDSTYITPPELNWAVWSSLIHGARGVIYFNHTFAGPALSNDNLASPYFQTVQPGQSVSMYTQVRNTDALIKKMAPVLNSPTALNYVTSSTPGYQNGQTLSNFSGIEVTAKDENGQFYIFADTRDSETQTNIPATFTLADKNATSVTVVNENRTIAVKNGVFSDTFTTGATVHIYEVNDSGSTSTSGTTSGGGAPPPSTTTTTSVGSSGAAGTPPSATNPTITFSSGAVVTSGNPSPGQGTLTLSTKTDGLTIGVGPSILEVTSKGQTVAFKSFPNEQIIAGSHTNETFTFTKGFGNASISGFIPHGAGHDILEFNTSSFSYLNSTMSQAQDLAAVLKHAIASGANTTIANSAGDTVTLYSTSIAALSANPADFKFV